MMRRIALTLACLGLVLWPLAARPQSVATALGRLDSQIFVSGREVSFAHLRTSRGEPVVRIDDPGLATMLQLVGAKMQFQPGTRFLVFTRSDGTLVTFTVGSNVVSIDDASTALPVGPFYQDSQLYVPLSALAHALGLAQRRFHGNYAFSPQILSVQRRIGLRRTIVEIEASAPLAWRSVYSARAKHETLTLTFPGFANAASTKLNLGGREAKAATIAQQGPPGYPITSLTIDLMHRVKFAARRMSDGSTLDLVLARNDGDLTLSAPVAQPSVQTSRTPKAAPTGSPSAAPTVVPIACCPPVAIPVATTTMRKPSANPSAAPVPTAVPAPEVTDVAATPSSSPSAESPAITPSSSPSPLQKITDVSVAEAPDISRVTLTVTGPVSFEWHRLAPPDNRFWVDISQAALVGPARDIAVKLPAVRSVKISQHQIAPDHVVRLIIDPLQPVDVVIGAIEGAPNQLGVEIRANAPAADAPASGVGALAMTSQTPRPVAAITPGPPHPNLVIIDPGHGGNDPGAINSQYGLVESHLTLAIAQRLKADLERAGWRVVLTRDGDYEVGDPAGDDHQELQARCDIANAAGARLFISVHINSSFSSGPSGLTTYFWRPSDRTLAQMIQNATVRTSGAGNDGVKRENFYVIHHTLMAAILVENAYLSNARDATLLSQPAFLDRLAAGIAQGVKDYTGGPPPP
ncbi:MAG: N-acetylmuramoyl-L-alanine amidase [Candidatus Eremiobacteraeota bacterium]|nr:N-acetylmuramoyl-L-alanine amidase [Candidatus Eremiobacteraeota bacterium]